MKGFWKGCIFAISSIISANITIAQVPSRENFNIVFENNYNDNSTGNYISSDFIKDWNAQAGSSPVGDVEILSDDASHQKVMRAYYPQGTIHPSNNHGFTWYSYFPSKYEELYFSYDIRFKPGFEWVHGGKIPGMVGGSVTSGQTPTSSTGFSTRMMWKGGGNLVFYVYHHDQVSNYGDSYYWEGFQFQTGRWYNLTIRVVMNSISNGTAAANGILEGYVDGKLMFQKTDFKFRLNETIKIERMYLCSFFGGNTLDWAAKRDEWIDTDNYVAYNYSSNATNVPRGLQKNTTGVVLHPYLSNSGSGTTVSTPAAPTSLIYTALSKSSATLKWVDNSGNEAGFRVYRSLSSSDGFIEIASLSANTITYSDNSLTPGTKYYYKVAAYNQSGSTYSSVYSLTTDLLDTPAAPSQLKASAAEASVALSWVDNSSREQGFLLFRSLSATENFTQVNSCNANETSCIDNSITAGKTYYYKIRAYNADGNSDFSNVVSTTTTQGSELSDMAGKVFIDPENISDVNENGSINHPFNSWSDVTWKHGYTYLQKRGTTATVDKIQIGTSHVTLGAYGTGVAPVITSPTNSYLISGFEKKNVTISDLDLRAENAISSIYFMGSTSDSIVVERCSLTGNSNAIKIMDGITFTARYNTLSSREAGVYSNAGNNQIYYNVFSSCNNAVNIAGRQSQARIFNNVFVDNMEAIEVPFGQVTMYNNIFHMEKPGQRSLNVGTGKFMSDNNIYFPEQSGFAFISGKVFNKLDELKNALRTDMQSLASDPAFIDDQKSDFRLKSESPAINAGRNLGIATDITGVKVPLFSRADIGAFEFDGNFKNSLNQTSAEVTLKLYPNPSTGPVTVEADFSEMLQYEPEIGIQELKVLDITGKIVFSKRVTTSDDFFQDQIDLSEQPNGMYFVVLQLSGKTIKNRLVIYR